MTNWNVSFTKILGGKPETIVKSGIQAASQQEAIQKAQLAIANPSQYTQVTAQQATGMPSMGEPDPNDMDQNSQPNEYNSEPGDASAYINPRLNMKESFKRNLSFPYTIICNKNQLSFITESFKADDVIVVKKGNNYYIEISKPDLLEKFVRKLLEQKNSLAYDILTEADIIPVDFKKKQIMAPPIQKLKDFFLKILNKIIMFPEDQIYIDIPRGYKREIPEHIVNDVKRALHNKLFNYLPKEITRRSLKDQIRWVYNNPDFFQNTEFGTPSNFLNRNKLEIVDHFTKEYI